MVTRISEEISMLMEKRIMRVEKNEVRKKSPKWLTPMEGQSQQGIAAIIQCRKAVKTCRGIVSEIILYHCISLIVWKHLS